MTARIWVLPGLLMIVSCGAASPATTPVAPTLPAVITPAPVTTTTAPALAPCPLPDIEVGIPPETVSETRAIASDYGDVFTSIPGTSQIVFANDDGTPALAIVRGALPPTNWVGATERVQIRGVTGALGPLADGTWAVAWAESDDRCDVYSVFIYPPGTVADARRVADSIR